MPDAGRSLFAVKQDDTLPEGTSLTGTPEGGKPREQPASLGEASPAGGVSQGGVLEHPEQPMPPGYEQAEATTRRIIATPTLCTYLCVTK